MSFTFSDQQSLLSSLLGDSNTGTDDQFPLAQRKKAINRGEWCFAKDTKYLREKTSGTVSGGSITVPTDFLEIYCLIVNDLVLTNDREVSVKEYERWNSYSGSVPLYYFSEESSVRYIKFFGSPNGTTYSLYYIKKPTTELSSDSDVSLFPEEYREASVYYAAYQLMMQIGKNDISDKYMAIYQKYVRDAQAYSERLYVDKNYANPDVNSIGGFTNDTQGTGYDFGN